MSLFNSFFPYFDSKAQIEGFEIQQTEEDLIQGQTLKKNEYSSVVLLETSPLQKAVVLDVDRSALLCRYIFNKFAKEDDKERVSCLSKTPVIILSSGAIGSGYVSWYPIILGVLKLGIESKVVKVILAGGSWISYGSLYAWGTLEIVQELFKKRSELEASLLENTTHPCISILYKSTIAILGLGATLPNAYFAYTFNQKNVFWTITNITGSWGICAYPIHNMFVELQMGIVKCGCHQSCIEKTRWDQVREFLCLKLDCLLQDISKVDTNFISKIAEEREDLSNINEYAKLFFQILITQYRQEEQDLEHVGSILRRKIVQYPVKAVSVLLPIANIYANAKATWNLIGEFTDLTIIKSLIIPVALAPSYLTYSLNRDCLLFVIKQIISKVLKKEDMPLSSIYYPKTRTVVILTAVVLSLLSGSIDYATAREIFSNDTFIDWTATTASMVNSLALTLLPMIGLSTMALDHCVSFLRNSNVKFEFEMSEKIKELKFYFSNSSQEELEKFVFTIMENEIVAKEFLEKFPWLSGDVSGFEDDISEENLLEISKISSESE